MFAPTTNYYRMKKLLTSLFLFFFFVTLTSCAHQTNTHKLLSDAKKSFIKIETSVRLVQKECDENQCVMVVKQPWMRYSSGSGAVVLYQSDKAVLTAAHVCKPEAFGFFGELSKNVETKLIGIDINLKKHELGIIKFNKDLDVCLLTCDTVSAPALRLSTKKPEYGDRAYNVAAPLGMANGNIVPAFQGLFFGEDSYFGKSFYSIPTIGGSSGSPILDSKGELIGMIHSVHYKFHHLAVSISYAELWNFLKSMGSQTLIIEKEPQHLDSLLVYPMMIH